MGIFEGFIRRVALAIGYLFGATKVAAPGVAEIEQEAWAFNQVKVLDPQIAAQLVAQHIYNADEGRHDASGQGINAARFAALVALSVGPPGQAIVDEMMRRGLIDDKQYEYALSRAGIEGQFHNGIKALLHTHLAPADVANAIQQGFMHNPGILAVSPPTQGGKIPKEPVSGIDPLREWETFGIDKERGAIMARLAGLPPGPMELLEMLRRGIIEDSDVLRGIAEGHTKTEWGEAYLKLQIQPLSAPELANLVVRQWLPYERAAEEAKKVGVSPEHFRFIVDGTGRPPGPGQLQTALNRGLINHDRFNKGIAESDVRPEWADVMHGLRVRYPTVFALRQLVSSGSLTAGEGEAILKLEGYPPDLAAKIAKAWSAAKTSKHKELALGTIEDLYQARYIDQAQAKTLIGKLGYAADEITLLLELADAKRVRRFLDSAVGRIHAKFITHALPERLAVQELNKLHISSQAVADLMAEWTLERDVNAPVLTPAQWVAAYHYEVVTRQEAKDALLKRGYTDREAEIMIDTRQHGTLTGHPL